MKLTFLETEPGWELEIQSLAYGWRNMQLENYSAVSKKQCRRTIGMKVLPGPGK